MSSLLELARYGQSYWLDDLSRTLIESGELERRVKDAGLSGVTDNPAIFNAALDGSDAYDAQIRRCAGMHPIQIYEALIVADVRDACDILRPVYDSTAGRDGFVSLEVSPQLARDTQGSIVEARRLWEAVERPNLLIKIPGTPEGVPAIETLLVEGINVNVTLLFAIESYQAVAQAYVRALEQRNARNEPIDRIASVASFFLSRIDTLVDEKLQDRIKAGDPLGRELLGRIAIANARLAYQHFKEVVEATRWKALERAGARPQRLLWASTSTKNPAYDDLMYVEPLIGPQTVNTMPAKTIAAFADHGKAAATLELDIREAWQAIEDLGKTGINLARVTEQLLEEGIDKFTKASNQTLQKITNKAPIASVR
ncbi:MAG TPA: transaldolase [Steroidobacteraceae bacterium]|jgi:transaldolase